MSLKIAVVGSRDFPDKDFVLRSLADTFDIEDELISGGAKGVDTWAEEWADSQGITAYIYPADWKKHGKKAGFLRNEQIVEAADMLVAFWANKSPGTKHSINLAHNKKIPVVVFIAQSNGKFRMHSNVVHGQVVE